MLAKRLYRVAQVFVYVNQMMKYVETVEERMSMITVMKKIQTVMRWRMNRNTHI